MFCVEHCECKRGPEQRAEHRAALVGWGGEAVGVGSRESENAEEVHLTNQ